MTAQQGAEVCVKKGVMYVFVSDGKVNSISNQNAAGLAKYASENTKLSGEMSGLGR
jgi:hypothetical protein